MAATAVALALTAGAASAGVNEGTVSPDPLVRGGNATLDFDCPGHDEWSASLHGQPSGNSSLKFDGALSQAGTAQVVISLDFLDPADTSVTVLGRCFALGDDLPTLVIEDTLDLVDPPATTVAPPTVAPVTQAAPAAPAAEPADLPRTGTNVTPFVVIAFLSLAAGVGMAWRARLRRA